MLILSACAAPPQVPIELLPPLPAEQLFGWLEASGRHFSSLSTLAKTRVTTPERSLTFQQALLVAAPDRLRVEALSPFGMPLLQLAVADGTLKVYTPGDGRFFSGAASAASLGRFTRLPLTAEALVGFLLQQVPYDSRLQPRVEVVGAAYRLTLVDATAAKDEQRFVFAPDGRLLSAAYLYDGTVVLEALYAPAAAVEDFPAGLTLRLPADKIELAMTFAESDTVSVPPAERFVLQPPEGTAVLPLP
jgi:hypothetical protein